MRNARPRILTPNGRLLRVEITAWRCERDPKAKGPFPVFTRKKSEKITRIFSGFFILYSAQCFSGNPLQFRPAFRRDFISPFNPPFISPFISRFYPELFPRHILKYIRWQYPEFLQTCLKPILRDFCRKSYTNTSGQNKRDRRDDMRPYVYPSVVRRSYWHHIHTVSRLSAMFYMLYSLRRSLLIRDLWSPSVSRLPLAPGNTEPVIDIIGYFLIPEVPTGIFTNL